MTKWTRGVWILVALVLAAWVVFYSTLPDDDYTKTYPHKSRPAEPIDVIMLF